MVFPAFKPGTACDVCGDPHLVEVYETKPYLLSNGQLRWGWAVCEKCQLAIQGKSHRYLARRTVEAAESMGNIKLDPKVKSGALRHMEKKYREFFSILTGKHWPADEYFAELAKQGKGREGNP